MKIIGWALALFAIALLALPAAHAADDPSIQGETRAGVQQALKSHIDTNTVGGTYFIYDSVAGELLELTLAKVHEGIVKKGDFYVTCADFHTPSGDMVDLDFLVLEDGGAFKTVQAIVHKTDGKKRPYDLGS